MVKEIIKDSEHAQFLERFYNFTDSMIRSISLNFTSNGTRQIDVHILTRDSTTQENEGWVCVVINVDHVSEMAIRDDRNKASLQVISNGIHITTIDDNTGFEFGGALDPPRSLSELRKSYAFALGKTVSFEVLPY
jgi:hypothetical protein